MTGRFQSAQQEALFKAVLHNLQRLGYRDELLQKDYPFVDWFEHGNPERVAPAAAFGQTPQSYDSACFAVLLSNGDSGLPLIGRCRALGAPYAFEVREDVIVNWLVGRDLHNSKELFRIPPDAIDRAFQDHQEKWTGADVLRTKGISFKLGPRQLDFIDLGLIPALEQQISSKLDLILREVVQEALKLFKKSQRNNQEPLRSVYRLVFRFLASKVLHDRGIQPFAHFHELTDRSEILDEVAKYYGEQPIAPGDALQDLVAFSIWTQLDFRNLSVEVLAYIYENTFADSEARKTLGTHGTPHSVARYLVHQIPYENFDVDQRQTLEPFCGHGVFLVAALQRLRELLPLTMDGKERHKYFVRMLRGFELDQFALEVSRLCLMLADFPNHNGWKLSPGDIFESGEFVSAVKHSRIVLSNPPFEDFTSAAKKDYPDISSVHKPVEFLNRVLDNLPADGVLGVVLPRLFLDGQSYQIIRKRLFDRFQTIQLVSLPDGVFEKSDTETVLVIGTAPSAKTHTSIAVNYIHVAENDRDRFLTEYGYSRRDDVVRTAAEASESLNVVQLRELWERLKTFPRLSEFAEIHQGIQWEAGTEEADVVSSKPKAGFRQGILRAHDLIAFLPPQTVYLSLEQKFRRKRTPGAFELPWSEPKVFLNAARVSRGPWAAVAFSDLSGLVGTQRFHALWPKAPWTPKSVAALLNSPLANAFIAVHQFKRDISKKAVGRIPLPRWEANETSALERLVSDYEEEVDSSGLGFDTAKGKLLAIDAFILKGYGLSPRLERELLDLFRGLPRPVPFEFSGYFPDEFTSNIPLWMFLSPEYQKCNPGIS